MPDDAESATSTQEFLEDHPNYSFKDSFKHMGESYGEAVGEHIDTTYGAVTDQMAEHVTPRLLMYKEELHKAKEILQQYEQELEGKVQEYVGPTYSTPTAWGIVFVLMVLPLALLIAYLLDQLSSKLSLDQVLLFANGYGCVYFLTLLVVMGVSRGHEPLTVLQASNSDAYIMFQLGVAFVFTLYLAVHFGMLCSVQLILVAMLRMASCACIGTHYYIRVWQPSMLDKPPNLGNPYIAYSIYAFIYLVNCLLPSVPIAGEDTVLSLLDDGSRDHHD
eukprot:CAMPEP_0196585368 /NCGR_PEP_ID=MMETSP1081-20130531/50397_1 /TAXON_ID=36882 /ORGANISM="Pyramimonas amylifera, Strain CCMP720" /LENGTH=275 /DNA_ID=CAMNT_0041906889 /DNA_START=108 /DNA_END=935 /DNA_ORIENTATION=+